MTGPTVSLRAALEGQPADTAPYACSVLAGRFVDDVGNWEFAVVNTPLTKPFTHWWPLPDLAAALAQPAPPTEATEARARKVLADAIRAQGDSAQSAEGILAGRDHAVWAKVAIRAMLAFGPTEATPPHDGLREAARRVLDEKAPAYHDCTDNGEAQCAWCDLEAALAAVPAHAPIGAGEATVEQWQAAADALDLSQEEGDAPTSVHVEAVAEALGVRRPSAKAVLQSMLAAAPTGNADAESGS